MATYVYRRKIAYEYLHPETKNGGDRGNQYTGGKAVRQIGELPPDRFTTATANATGHSEEGRPEPADGL